MKVKTEYGIKCQAYSIIDTVNNEYLQCNVKLKEEIERLQEESRKTKEQMEYFKRKLFLQQQTLPPTPAQFTTITTSTSDNEKLVDLTSEEISDDDEIQIVSTFKVTKECAETKNADDVIIEINDDDDDDDVQIVNSQPIIDDNQQHHSIQPLDVATGMNPEIVPEIPAVSIEKSNEAEQAVNEIQKYLDQDDDDDDDESPEMKKARLGHENDFKFLQDFILSQI